MIVSKVFVTSRVKSSRCIFLERPNNLDIGTLSTLFLELYLITHRLSKRNIDNDGFLFLFKYGVNLAKNFPK